MKKLNFFGIGPKVAIVLIPWLAATIVASVLWDEKFRYGSPGNNVLTGAGIVMMTAGLVFYFSTVRSLLKGLKETKLMTKGAYSICQNPLYSSILLCIVPALSLILNSWLILTTTAVGYIMFKIFIKQEYAELEKFFGEEYLRYKSSTPEFFPFLK